MLVGERRRWCYDSGDWNWPELGTAECIPENQYNTMQVKMTMETMTRMKIMQTIPMTVLMTTVKHPEIVIV